METTPPTAPFPSSAPLDRHPHQRPEEEGEAHEGTPLAGNHDDDVDKADDGPGSRAYPEEVEDDEDEEDECRVCRGPAEPGRPLFKPCKCSGSIGLTHQDCLQSWLEVQRGSGSCELCKTRFRFSPLYADGAPARIPALQVLAGLTQRALVRWVPFLVRSMFAIALWLLVAPLVTAYLYHGWMDRPSAVLDRFRWNFFSNDLASGAVVAACIIVSFLSMMSFADFLRVEWQQRRFRRRRRDPLERADPQPQEEDVDNGIWDYAQRQVMEQPRGLHRYRLAAPPLAPTQHRPQRHPRAEGRVRVDMPEDEWVGGPIHRPGTLLPAENAGVFPPLDIDHHRFLDADDDDEEQDGDEDDDDASWVEEEDELVADDHDNEDDEEDHDEGEDEGDDDADEWDDLDEPREDAAMPRAGNGPNNPARRGAGERRRRIVQAVDMEQDEAADLDINIALDELLGVRGPLAVVVRNLLWLLAFNAVYIGFFVFMPRTIGNALWTITFNGTIVNEVNRTWIDDPNVTTTTTAGEGPPVTATHYSLSSMYRTIEYESKKLNTTFRLSDLLAVTIGYLSCAAAVLLFRFLFALSRKLKFLRGGRIGNNNNNNNNVNQDVDELDGMLQEMQRAAALGPEGHFAEEPPGVDVGVAIGVALEALMAIVKVGVLLFLKMFVLPIVLGLCLDASLTCLIGGTLDDRLQYAGKDLFSFVLLHWVFGITFMLLVTVSVLQLREVAHPDLFAQTIRPQEPQPDLLGNLMHESVSTHAKRMVLSLFIYAILLANHVYVPTYILSRLGVLDRLSFLQLKFCHILPSQLQVPVELLIFHLCMLGILEKYKNGIGEMQHYWLKNMARYLGLTEKLLPLNVEGFRLLGSRPVFSERKQVDKFWYEIAKMSEMERERVIQENLDGFRPALVNVVIAGETKPNGDRLIRHGSDFIRLPWRLPGRTLRSRAILLSTKSGRYRLARDLVNSSSPMIQVWEEVVGNPIPRPPEGWDDLGVGGADEQGRWAWGREKMSSIERGVARRHPFFDKDQSYMTLIRNGFKVFALLYLSWFATSFLLAITLAGPLVVGRLIFFLLRLPDRWVHDPLGYALGFFVTFPLFRKWGRSWISSDTSIFVRARNWLLQFRPPSSQKAAVFLCTLILWFLYAPLLLGVVYEIALVLPLEMFEAKSLRFDVKFFALTWATGTFLLSEWSLLCVMGVLTRRFRNLIMEGVVDNDEGEETGEHSWQGKHGRMARFYSALLAVLLRWEWEKVDEVVLLQDCAVPVVISIFWSLAVPAAVWGVCFQWFPSLSSLHIALLVRSALVATSLWQVGRVWQEHVRNSFEAAHNAARDDLYLVGEILMNYGE